MAISSQLTLGEISLLTVDADPSLTGISAPIGSMSILDDKVNSKIWIKSGSTDTSWSIVPRHVDGSALIAGGIIFSDVNGILIQDETRFFWDNSNKKLGIGLSSPTALLHIDGGNATATYHKFTAGTTTGQTSTDGLDIGIDSTGIAEIKQRENLDLKIYTNNLERLKITNTGQVGIGATPVASAILQIDSTTQGFLLPRMTSAQRLAIVSPATGLMVYDTGLTCRCVYASTHWTFEYDLFTSAIQTSTSTTYANITELVTASLEPGLYAIRLRGIAQSTVTTTGIGLRLNVGTAAVSTVNINWCFSQAGAGTDKNFEYSQITTADNVTSAATIVNTDFPVSGDGVVRVTTAGTLVIQIRTKTTGSGVSIRPNTTLILRKVGN